MGAHTGKHIDMRGGTHLHAACGRDLQPRTLASGDSRRSSSLARAAAFDTDIHSPIALAAAAAGRGPHSRRRGERHRRRRVRTPGRCPGDSGKTLHRHNASRLCATSGRRGRPPFGAHRRVGGWRRRHRVCGRHGGAGFGGVCGRRGGSGCRGVCGRRGGAGFRGVCGRRGGARPRGVHDPLPRAEPLQRQRPLLRRLLLADQPALHEGIQPRQLLLQLVQRRHDGRSSVEISGSRNGYPYPSSAAVCKQPYLFAQAT